MKNNPITPIVVSTIQLFCLLHLLYLHYRADSAIPKALIFLHFYAFLSFFILTLGYFAFFKSQLKTNLWLIPIGFSIIFIFTLIICYIIMGFDKYS